MSGRICLDLIEELMLRSIRNAQLKRNPRVPKNSYPRWHLLASKMKLIQTSVAPGPNSDLPILVLSVLYSKAITQRIPSFIAPYGVINGYILVKQAGTGPSRRPAQVS